MFNHSTAWQGWEKSTVETAPNSSRITMWLPDFIWDDKIRKQQVSEAIITAYIYGVIVGSAARDSEQLELRKQKLENRKQWGERLGSGQEGAVYRLQNMPDHVAKIFKPGRGTNLDVSNGIEAHRAGKSVLTHALLYSALSDSAQFTTPRPKGIAVHPESKIAVTVMEFVDGHKVGNKEATMVHDAVNEVLIGKGINEIMRKSLLHDVLENGGNVLKYGSPGQDTLFPVYSLIDR